MSGQPESQGEETEKGKPPKPRPAIVRIFRALKRYENRRRRRRNSQHQVNERMLARWTRHVGLFTGALVVVGIVTAVIFWRQLNVMQGQLNEMRSASEDTKRAIEASNRLADAAKRSGDIADSALQSSREALERSQRAWIGPVDAEIEPDDIQLTVRPAKIRLRVIYQNTGREPALDVTSNAIGGTVPVQYGFRDWDHLQIPENKTCGGLSPTRGNIIAYPSTTSSPTNDIIITATVKDGGNAVTELTSGKQILWINGCIAYTTIKTPHQSAFCFFSFPRSDKAVRQMALQWLWHWELGKLGTPRLIANNLTPHCARTARLLT